VIVPDINLRLYAFIDSFDQHRAARQWWLDAMNSDREIGLTSPTLFGFLRISTSRRVLDEPLTIGAALEYVRAWLARPNARFLSPGPRHLDVAFGLLAGLGTAANLTTDVQIATYAIENRAEVHSTDTDFGRFPDLAWVNPLA
jgi:toxin-antitoxin system PIN domain toxin